MEAVQPNVTAPTPVLLTVKDRSLPSPPVASAMEMAGPVRVTVMVYVFSVPSSAVTTTSMVLGPTLIVIALLAEPLVTAVSFDCNGSVAISRCRGHGHRRHALLATVEVYAVSGSSEIGASASPEKLPARRDSALEEPVLSRCAGLAGCCPFGSHAIEGPHLEVVSSPAGEVGYGKSRRRPRVGPCSRHQPCTGTALAVLIAGDSGRVCAVECASVGWSGPRQVDLTFVAACSCGEIGW